MPAYLLKRVVQALFVMWGVATLVFVLVRLIGNPALLMLPSDATPDEVAVLTQALGLTKPLPQQYIEYLQGLLRGDLGRSLWMKVPNADLILAYLPPTLWLTLTTWSLALFTGVGLGILAAARPGAPTDRLVTILSFASVSVPQFWIGLSLISLISVQLRLLPTSGYGGWQHFVLPMAALAVRPMGRLAQITRTVVSEEMSKQYIVTAFGKGLHARTVLVRHAMRNSIPSVITIGADEIAALIGGAVIVESIFAWPGLGQLSFQAIRQRDAELVVAIVIVLSGFVVLLNLLVDLIYAWSDPRIKYR